MTIKHRINRRDFLKASMLAGGGLLLSFSIPSKAAQLSGANATATLNAFLSIGSDNTINITIGKVEMGQGVWTTLPMLIAEELDCDWNRIKVSHRPSGVDADFNGDFLMQSTGGSDTTRSEFDRYRMAGATARTMLVLAGAKRLGVQPADCLTENGFVIAGEKKVSYGEVAGDASALPIPVVNLRTSDKWKYIGKPQRRLDTPEKINGQTIYGIDIHFPGLLTAVIARPPVFGSKLKSFDAAKALAVVGVRNVVQVPAGVAVLADNYWSANQGKQALTIEWDLTSDDVLDSNSIEAEYKRLSKTSGVVSQQKGDTAAGLAKATKMIEASYVLPYLAHAPMEPLNCTVRIQANRCEVWTGTQSPLPHQAEVASFLGLRPEQVIFTTPAIGGSFGRRGSFNSDWVMEAVHIAKASGKPVKLLWSREDDIKGGYYRPLYVHRVSIGVDADGIPETWHHHIVGQSLFTNTPLESWIVQNGIDYSSTSGVHGSQYINNVPNHSVELHTTSLKVPVLAWRAVGATHSAFVMETLIDELAFMAGKDPVTYRNVLLKDSPRHLATLNLAAEKAGWHLPLPPGRFRGIAIHDAMGSYVCQVVELSVVDKKIKLYKVVCAIDCGLAVNPEGVKAQMESGIVFGLTAALYGEITLVKGQVRQSNFNDYRMLRINEMPSIEVYVVPSTGSMGGAGEPGVPPIAPALANAIFAATGKRLRRLPVKIA